jgi:Uma2 family endonuclease
MSAVLEKVWTEAELAALPNDGYRHELIHGELVMSPKNNFQHEQICQRLNFALETFNRPHHLGAILGSNMGFWMENRNCRAPDLSFVSRARLLELGFKSDTQTFFPGAPDLAIEVLSPGNTPREMDERLADFFASGSRIVWIIHPQEQFVEVCHSRTDRRSVGMGGVIEGEHVLPEFRLPVSEIFKSWHSE